MRVFGFDIAQAEAAAAVRDLPAGLLGLRAGRAPAAREGVHRHLRFVGFGHSWPPHLWPWPPHYSLSRTSLLLLPRALLGTSTSLRTWRISPLQLWVVHVDWKRLLRKSLLRSRLRRPCAPGAHLPPF